MLTTNVFKSFQFGSPEKISFCIALNGKTIPSFPKRFKNVLRQLFGQFRVLQKVVTYTKHLFPIFLVQIFKTVVVDLQHAVGDLSFAKTYEYFIVSKYTFI